MQACGQSALSENGLQVKGVIYTIKVVHIFRGRDKMILATSLIQSDMSARGWKVAQKGKKHSLSLRYPVGKEE